MGSKPRRNNPASKPFYATQPAPAPYVVPQNPSGGIMLITGRPGAGQGYMNRGAPIGLPLGDKTLASHKEQIEIHMITNRLKRLMKEPEKRQIARISDCFHRPDTKGKLRLLRFYDRYVSFKGDMEYMFGTGEIILSFPQLHDLRVTSSNIHGVSKVACAVLEAVNVPSNRALMEIGFTHWERAGDISSIILDRGITDAATVTQLLDEMGSHPSALTEGVL